jgi:TRADD-N domain-containing protein
MAEHDAERDAVKSDSIASSNFVVGGDIRIADSFKIDGVTDRTLIAGRDSIIVTKIIERKENGISSSEQALGRIAGRVRLNLGQVKADMEQARKESSQFFRPTLVFSGIGFVIILAGIGLMLAKLVTVGIVTTVASIIPEGCGLLFFNKDRELRRTIETYHERILKSQDILTTVDIAETFGAASAKDAIKEKIIMAVLKAHSTGKLTTTGERRKMDGAAVGHGCLKRRGSARPRHHRGDDLHLRRVGAVVALTVEDYYAQKKRWWLRLREKNGNVNGMPCHHKLEEYLDAYIKAAGVEGDRKEPLFRAAIGKTKKLGRARYREPMFGT